MASEQTFGTVTITAVPDNLIVKGVDSIISYLGESSDFTLSFYTA